MKLPQSLQPAPYPIELALPDISRYRTSATGIDYVHTFESGLDGPHVMVNALTHGNEVCGAIAVSELLERQLRPVRGKLTLAFANVEAYKRFDASRPDANRFIEEDFNRLWSREALDGDCNSAELHRARQLRPVIDQVDYLLDLHSMHEASAPLLVSGPLPKGIAFARNIGSPVNIIVDEGHAEGRRLRDYDAFGDQRSARNALLVECGQHWEASAATVARDVTARFLRVTGVIAPDGLADWIQAPAASLQVVRVTDAVVARTMRFRFTQEFRGLERIKKKGTVIAVDDGQEIRTPYDDCVLVMPSLRQLRPGVTVVRLGMLEQD
jgi:predicted deacylase